MQRYCQNLLHFLMYCLNSTTALYFFIHLCGCDASESKAGWPRRQHSALLLDTTAMRFGKSFELRYIFAKMYRFSVHSGTGTFRYISVPDFLIDRGSLSKTRKCSENFPETGLRKCPKPLSKTLNMNYRNYRK